MATLRQKKAAIILAEKGGSVSGAMRRAGYTDITAATPKKLTASKGWAELMEEYLPDTLLAKKHNQLLNKINSEGEIDPTAVKNGLDLAYKLKGSFAEKEKEVGNVTINVMNFN